MTDSITCPLAGRIHYGIELGPRPWYTAGGNLRGPVLVRVGRGGGGVGWVGGWANERIEYRVHEPSPRPKPRPKPGPRPVPRPNRDPTSPPSRAPGTRQAGGGVRPWVCGGRRRWFARPPGRLRTASGLSLPRGCVLTARSAPYGPSRAPDSRVGPRGQGKLVSGCARGCAVGAGGGSHGPPGGSAPHRASRCRAGAS